MNHHWQSKYPINPDKEIGFIYAVINEDTGQTYYGRKQFCKFRRRKRLADDSWKFYMGSSKSLQADINQRGVERFSFHIIATFVSKSGMAIGEALAIICSGSLEQPDKYYNRAAPSIRGSIKISEEDARGLRRIKAFINGREKELRKYARRHLEEEGPSP